MRSPQREKMTKFQNNYIKNLKKRPMEIPCTRGRLPFFEDLGGGGEDEYIP